jgi:GcrA cell cycle regulator
MAWTEDRVEMLKQLWTDGLSASQIARKMGGVTRNAVIGKVHRLGRGFRPRASRQAPHERDPRRPRCLATIDSAAVIWMRLKTKSFPSQF